MGKLDQKVVIVTGGAVSLGAQYTCALAREGARVVVADIVGAEAVIGKVSADGGEAVAITTDVSDEESVRKLIAETIDRYGRVDVLVNNAAVFAVLDSQPVSEIDVELWDSVMAVNIRGPFLLIKHVVPHMIGAGGGKIINVSSGVAYKGMANMSHYATSKAALLGLTRSLSRELGQHNVCVNTLAPGLIASDSLADREDHVAGFRDRVVASRAIRRDGYGADLIGALLFLASGDSDFVTGQTIAVDGGSINT